MSLWMRNNFLLGLLLSGFLAIAAGCSTPDDNDSTPESSQTPEPTATPPASRAFPGDRLDDSERAGGDVSALADMDGDESPDFAVGAYGADGSAGRIYVVSGKSAGGNLNDIAFAQFNGESFGNLSASVSGDFTGDGEPDLIGGAYNVNGGRGRFYLVSGPLNPGEQMIADAASTIWDEEGAVQAPDGSWTNNYSGLGYALAVGDFNDDGQIDLIVGAPSYGTQREGAVYLVLGPLPEHTSMSFGSVSIKLVGLPNSRTGYALAAGDVNGDGYDDMLIGAPGDGDPIGSAYLIYGRDQFETTLTTDATFQGYSLNGVMDAEVGASVAVGDVSGDGNMDVVLGAPGAGYGDGDVYVVRGPLSRNLYDMEEDGYDINGPEGSNVGVSVATGDVNGDSIGDLVIGATHYDNDTTDTITGGGAALVVYGPISGSIDLATQTNRLFQGQESNARAGASVAVLPDLNDDGADEILYGAPDVKSDAYLDVGAAYFEAGQP